MALLKGINKFGVSFDSAYHKIDHISANKSNINVNVLIYVSDEARLNDAETIDYKSYQFPYTESLSGTNPIQQAYNLLKTLPEYAGATDV